LQCVAVCCTVLHYGCSTPAMSTKKTTAGYSLLQSVAVCCSLLQSVAVYCSLLRYSCDEHEEVLLCVAVCCSMLQYYPVCYIHTHIHTHKQTHVPLHTCICQYISADPTEMLTRAKAVCNLFRGAKTFHNFCSPARVPALRLFARKNWKLLPFSSASLREGGQYTHTHKHTHYFFISLAISLPFSLT